MTSLNDGSSDLYVGQHASSFIRKGIWSIIACLASIVVVVSSTFVQISNGQEVETAQDDASASINQTIEDIDFQETPIQQDLEASGYQKVPLGQIVDYLEQRNQQLGSSRSMKIRSRAQLDSNTLIGYSQITVAEDGRNTLPLSDFSPAVLTPNHGPIGSFAEGMRWSEIDYFDSDGAAVLKKEAGNVLNVPWQCYGMSTNEGAEVLQFDITFPWSTESTLEILLEDNKSLTNCTVPCEDTGLDEKPVLQAGTSNGRSLRRWLLHVGAAREVRFEITNKLNVGDDVAYVFNSEQFDWIAQSSGLEILASFILDAPKIPKQMLLKVDEGVRIRSVTWDQQPLEFNYSETNQTLQIDIPASDGMFAGTQHRLLVNAISRWPMDSNSDVLSRLTKLPCMHVAGALAVSGRGSLSLSSDWELVDFQSASADLVSRSGTTTQGGISRLDYKWTLARPTIKAKLVRKFRPRKAESLVTFTNSRDQLSAEAKVRFQPSSEVWNSLVIQVSAEWVFQSASTVGNEIEMTVHAEQSVPGEVRLIFPQPIENRTVDLQLSFRTASPMERIRGGSGIQKLTLPRTKPYRIQDTVEDVVYEYAPSSGFSLAIDPWISHLLVMPGDLDVWRQSQLASKNQSSLLRYAGNDLPASYLERQRANLTVHSLLHVVRSVNWSRNTLVVDIHPDQGGIQRLDLGLPNDAKQIIWRVTKNDEVIQEWQQGQLRTPEGQTGGDITKNLNLRFGRSITEPFILECRYRMPLETEEILLPVVGDFDQAERYILVDDDFEPMGITEQGRVPLEKLANTLDPATKYETLNALLKALTVPADIDNVFVGNSELRALSIHSRKQSKPNLTVAQTRERMYCDNNGELLYEFQISTNDLSQTPLIMSLPKGWKVASVNSKRGDVAYISKEADNRNVCEIALAPSPDPQASNELTLQWSGPKLSFQYGYSNFTIPTVQANFRSIDHQTHVFLSQDLVSIITDPSWKARVDKNVKAASKPWLWSSIVGTQEVNYLPHETIDLVQKTDTSIAYNHLQSQFRRKSFCDFNEDSSVVGSEKIWVANSRLISLQRWLTGALACILCIMLLRWFSMASAAIVCGLVMASLFLVRLDLTLAAIFGIVVGLTLQVMLLVISQAKDQVFGHALSSSKVSLQQGFARGGSRSNVPSKSLTALVIAVASLALSESNLFSQELNSIAEQQTNPGVIIPFDSKTLLLEGHGFIKDQTFRNDEQDRSEENYQLLSAQHVFVCRPNYSVFAIPTATVTSTYRFRIDKADQPVTFPWGINNVVFVQFLVDGKPLAYSKSLAPAENKLVWTPGVVGEVVVQLKAEMRSRNIAGRETAQVEVLPCAAGQAKVETELQEVNLRSGLHTKHSIADSRWIPVAREKVLELTWNVPQASRLQYDADTQIDLNQDLPMTITRLRIGGLTGRSQVVLEWNGGWVPIGAAYRDAMKTGAIVEGSSLGRSKCQLQVVKKILSNSDVLDLEIYWRPSTPGSTTLTLPDPRIIDATPNIRTLRYTQEATARWAITGVESWSQVTPANDISGNTVSEAANTSIVLRIPDSSSNVTVRKTLQQNTELADARVQVEYLLGSRETLVKWKGILVRPMNQTVQHSWLIDSSLKIQSVRLNGQDTLFSSDKVADDLHLVKAIGDQTRGGTTSVEIDAIDIRSEQQIEKELPLLHWCNYRIVQSQFLIARHVGLDLTLEQIPANAPMMCELRERSDIETPIPYVEVLTSAEEAVPYTLKYDSGSGDIDALNSIRSDLVERDLARIQVLQNPPSTPQKATATVAVDSKGLAFDFELNVESQYENQGLLFSVPTSEAGLIRSEAAIERLGRIDGDSLLYVKSVSQIQNDKRLHRIKFTLERLKDSPAIDFMVPRIDLLAPKDIQVQLVREASPAVPLEWDLGGWERVVKQTNADADEGTGDSVPSFYSSGGISPIRATSARLAQQHVTVPFAVWNLSTIDGRCAVDALLCVKSDVAGTTQLRLPAFFTSAVVRVLNGRRRQRHCC